LQSYIFYDFSKINTQTKFLQSYTDVAIWKRRYLATAVSNGGSHLPPNETIVGHCTRQGYYSVSTTISNDGRACPFFLNSNWYTLYMNIVAFIEIYNFIHFFYSRSSWGSNNRYTIEI
jgi:hypothetical protein